MNERHSKRTAGQTWMALRRGALAMACAALAAGCAPDSVRSTQAVGFNAYLKQLPQSCRPLQIGDQNMGNLLLTDAMGNNEYEYFIDVTSKLYYNRMSQASYRQALVGFFGAGTYNDASFDCIFRTLPPNRPNAPEGTY
jgi:hypothetical protein